MRPAIEQVGPTVTTLTSPNTSTSRNPSTPSSHCYLGLISRYDHLYTCSLYVEGKIALPCLVRQTVHEPRRSILCPVGFRAQEVLIFSSDGVGNSFVCSYHRAKECRPRIVSTANPIDGSLPPLCRVIHLRVDPVGV